MFKMEKRFKEMINNKKVGIESMHKPLVFLKKKDGFSCVIDAWA